MYPLAIRRPWCEHGAPKLWNKDKRRKRGGAWRCIHKRRAAQARADARYDASPKGRAVRARYNASPKGRAAQARYDGSIKGVLRDARRVGARPPLPDRLYTSPSR